MGTDCTAIIDIGKTHSKLTLWDSGGRLLANASRANGQPSAEIGGLRCRILDVEGIHEWLIDALSKLSSHGTIRQIVPVAHGAAAVLIQGGREYLPPLDYESAITTEFSKSYSAQREPFRFTGSPGLPNGLNLGMQLHQIEQLTGALPGDAKILLWPQYWAWRLCGEMACEVSSLGCHTDLWRPVQDRYSDLAVERGWAARMPPLVPADTCLGNLLPEVAAATGISAECIVLCGLHDSNAALLAARGHPDIADHEATVLSTGTWFVAMRSLQRGAKLDTIDLDERRDCLVNVDVYGHAIPSARFMGGREVEVIGGLGAFDIRAGYNTEAMVHRLPELVDGGTFVLPAFVPGVGPFPDASGRWERQPPDAEGQRAMASLYLALVADVSLDLIGSRERLLVDGRYAEDALFVRALATLRPEQAVLVASAQHDIAYGALRLVDPALPPQCAVSRVNPLDVDLQPYAAGWRARASRGQAVSEVGT